MKKIHVLFIQGGGEGAYEVDKELMLSLKDSLGKEYEVNYPKMPNEDDPNYNLYRTKIEKELNNVEDEVVLVGHSLGACFLLKYLTEIKNGRGIAGIFLISTPFWGKGGWQYEGFTINNELASEKTVKMPVFFYHSTDDETVPFSHLALYKKIFPHAKFREIDGGGHQLIKGVTEIVRDIQRLDTV